LEQLQLHCRSRIASYKKPTSVVLTEALPRRGHAIDYEAIEASPIGSGDGALELDAITGD
jgi:long-chain acyl-CoA synthetase